MFCLISAEPSTSQQERRTMGTIEVIELSSDSEFDDDIPDNFDTPDPKKIDSQRKIWETAKKRLEFYILSSIMAKHNWVF